MVARIEFDIQNIDDDILNRLRTNLNGSDSQSRVTEQTTAFTGTGSQDTFLLNASSLSYVKSVSVNSVVQKHGTDYTVIWRKTNMGSIKFTNAPALGASISVVWGKINTGQANWIFSDFPRTDLGKDTYPRIGFETTDTSEPGGCGSPVQQVFKHSILIQVKIVGVNKSQVIELTTKVVNFFKTNCRNFTYLSYIQPKNIQGYDNFRDNSDQAFQKVVEFVSDNKFEQVTLV